MITELSSLSDVWAIESRAFERYSGVLRGIDAKNSQDLIRTKDQEHEEALSFITSKRMDLMPGAFMTGVYDGVAVIPVSGIIRPRSSYNLYSLYSTNLVSLTHDLELALENPGVHAIVLNIDSPGGLAAGVDEFAQKIYDARGTKPIVSYVSDLIASAAYWIGSATDEIVMARTAEAGSIGTLVSFYDWTEFDKNLGIELVTIVNDESPKKGTSPASEEGRQQIRTRLNETADIFLSTVARNRGYDREKVVNDFGQGDLIVGEGAVAVGLVDRLGSFDSLLSEFATNHNSGGIGMTDQTPSPTAITVEMIAGEHPAIAKHFAEQGKAEGLEEGRQKGAEEERNRIQAIEKQFPEAGVQSIVNEHKFNPEMSVEKIGMKVLEAMRNGDIDQMAAIQEDAPEAIDGDASAQDQQAADAEKKSAREAAERANKNR